MASESRNLSKCGWKWISAISVRNPKSLRICRVRSVDMRGALNVGWYWQIMSNCGGVSCVLGALGLWFVDRAARSRRWRDADISRPSCLVLCPGLLAPCRKRGSHGSRGSLSSQSLRLPSVINACLFHACPSSCALPSQLPTAPACCFTFSALGTHIRCHFHSSNSSTAQRRVPSIGQVAHP